MLIWLRPIQLVWHCNVDMADGHSISVASGSEMLGGGNMAIFATQN